MEEEFLAAKKRKVDTQPCPSFQPLETSASLRELSLPNIEKPALFFKDECGSFQ